MLRSCLMKPCVLFSKSNLLVQHELLGLAVHTSAVCRLAESVDGTCLLLPLLFYGVAQVLADVVQNARSLDCSFCIWGLALHSLRDKSEACLQPSKGVLHHSSGPRQVVVETARRDSR